MARRRKKSTTSSKRRKSPSKRKPLKVRSNGKLRSAAGLKKGQKITKSKARSLAKSGSPATRKRANFYLNVLSKSKRKRRKK